MEEHKEKILTLLKELLDKMGVSADIETTDQSEGTLFNINTAKPDYFFSERKEYIVSLNHLFKKMTQSLLKEDLPFKFFLDVNASQKQRNDTLRELAKLSAQKVRYFQKEIVLKPMSSYERRIIHLALAGDPDITTESVGEDPERKVAIRPNLSR